MILWDRLTIRLPGRLSQVTDYQLLAAIQTFSSEDTVRVQEFTAVLDDRTLLPTLGFFVELAGPLGTCVLACSVMHERPLTSPIVR